MDPRNAAKLHKKIAAAGEAALSRSGYVTAVDALLATGWLGPADVEEWRRGRVAFLEQVVEASLPKISTAMRVFHQWARSRGLRPSQTAYVSWTKPRRPLRFSKSGAANIERDYSTHWLPPQDVRPGTPSELS
ncbi:hypothetical protein [Actinopolymorpha alba]|uniref:hypothetical protein n=1 Tax=Actinopolymorpha alba TaxID=533267 RepID=UPI00037BE318|nr:hypothetical protein [Actinopolymorpha alba]